MSSNFKPGFNLNVLYYLLLVFLVVSCGTGTETTSFSSGEGFSGTNLNISPGGGIGGSGGPTVSTGGGIGGTGKTIFGQVTDLENVTVNGITLDTSETSFIFDDNPGTESDLQIGMLVTVKAIVDDNGTSGKATSLIYDDELEGPIENIDIINNTLMAMGQIIWIDESTLFSNSAGLADLNIDDIIEVSGFVIPEGIQATWIELKEGVEFIPNGTPVETEGNITHLDFTSQTFYVRKQFVDFSGNVNFVQFSPNELVEGLYVEVKGTLDYSMILHATKIECEDKDLIGMEGDKLKIEGVVTSNPTGTQFELGNLTVQYHSETNFDGGSPANLLKGVKLVAEGVLNQNLFLVADKIFLRPNGNLRLEGTVENLNHSDQTITVLGTTVNIDSATMMKDNQAGLKNFALKHIKIGDWVDVKAYQENGKIFANLLTRENLNTNSKLQGKADRISPPYFFILDHWVETHAGTQYMDKKNNLISENDFFVTLKEGDMVRVEGIPFGQSFIADQVKLKK